MPPASPPTEAELMALAERGLAVAGPEAQATAWWERSIQASTGAHVERSQMSVELLAVIDGRPGVAATTQLDEAGLRVAAHRALEAAGQAPPLTEAWELPAPSVGRPHAGYDPALARLDPRELVAAGRRWRAGAARTAIVSTRGVAAYEQRSFAALTVDVGTVAEISATAVGVASLDTDALAARAASLEASGEPAGVPDGEAPAVLGPDAVAALLDGLRPQLADGGTLHARRGSRVAASAVSLSDSPRFTATLPRSFDAMGTPRQPVPLIQDGVAHRIVSARTGHATRAGGIEARPEHLVLVGGGAADEDELMAPVERGIYLPTLSGGFEIVDGRRGRPLAPARIRVDALRVLATTQVLGARQSAVAGPGSARTVGATVCPALRATGGVVLTA